jgi:hypothetical protein
MATLANHSAPEAIYFELEDKQLDLLTGFEIFDRDTRFFFLEGLKSYSMKRLISCLKE